MVRVVKLVAKIQILVESMGHRIQISPDRMVTTSNVRSVDVKEDIHRKTSRMETLGVMNTITSGSTLPSEVVNVDSIRVDCPLINGDLHFTVLVDQSLAARD